MIPIAINDYAKLYSVPPFRVDTEVVFVLELSDSYLGHKGDFTITMDGFEIYNQSDISFSTYIGDLRLFYITMPANTLGTIDAQSWSQSNYTAQVKINSVITGDELGMSNAIILDVMMTTVMGIVGFEENPVTEKIINSSLLDIELNYAGYTKSRGGRQYLNSYQIELIYEDTSEAYNSGELFDWDNFYTVVQQFTLKNLKDNTKYFLKFKATAINGYKTETPYYPFTTDFTPIPTTDDLPLENDFIDGSVIISKDLTGVTGTRVVLSRTLVYTNRWMEIKEIPIPTSKLISIRDYYAIAKSQYIYKLTVYNGDTFVEEYANNIIHEFRGICIADKNNHYCSEMNAKILPIQKNVPSNIVTTNNSKYAFYISNGITNYYSSSASAIFNVVKDECYLDFENSVNYRMDLAEFLSDRKPKFLKSDNGRAFLIAITGTPTIEQGEHKYLESTNFEWSEVGDKDNIEDYIRLGLI